MCGYGTSTIRGDTTILFYLKRAKDDLIPELLVCIAEALYDIASILMDPNASPEHEQWRCYLFNRRPPTATTVHYRS